MANTKKFFNFIDLLLQLLEHDVSLAQAVQVLSEQQDPIAKKVYSLMNKGNSFSTSLSNAVETKNDFLVYFSMIETSEKTGILVPILKNIYTDLQTKQAIKTRFINAITYPCAVIFLACAGTVFLVVQGIPYLAEQGIISSVDVRTMIAHSIFSFCLLLVLGLSFLFFFMYYIQKDSIYSRLFFMLYLLTSAHISLDKALSYCLPIIRQTKARKAIIQIKEQILQGKLLSVACDTTKFFPKILITWLVVAEKQGSVQNIFEKIGSFYFKQDEARKERMQRLCEPVIILITGVYIAVLLQGTILPILTNYGGL